MRALLITWGVPIAGRERLALEEFSSYMQWATSLQAQKKIARFEVFAPLFGSFESFSGCSILEGSAADIDAIADSDEFRGRMQRVMSVAHGVRTQLLAGGGDMLALMKLYGAQIQQLKI